jgi:hypothetical protein
MGIRLAGNGWFVFSNRLFGDGFRRSGAVPVCSATCCSVATRVFVKGWPAGARSVPGSIFSVALALISMDLGDQYRLQCGRLQAVDDY